MKSAFAGFDGDAAQTETIRTARTQVDRLRQLIASLRQVANVSADKLEREKVVLDELATEAVELAKTANPEAAERIQLMPQRIPWRPSPVMADRELLSQAIYNLLDNALKYSPPGKQVEVRVLEDDKRACVEVADAGRGIEQKDLPHVTDELYRGDRTDGVEGTGLGLALVQRVAQAHGGELKLRSRLNQGTVARLELPLA
jgi:signal transduction histidine kinase